MFLFPSFVNGPVSKGPPPNAAFQKAWYIIQPAVYNAGFAFVQIPHMSIVNVLTFSNRKRDQMANQRNACTFAANIVVLSAALVIFASIESGIW
jgi:Na+/melibiose symporter-like transporter